jgi:hypothetical protein
VKSSLARLGNVSCATITTLVVVVFEINCELPTQITNVVNPLSFDHDFLEDFLMNVEVEGLAVPHVKKLTGSSR